MSLKMVPKTKVALADVRGVVIGHIAELTTDGQVLVDFAGSAQGPRPAPLLTALTRTELQHAVANQQPAALIFIAEDPARPLLLGLIQPPPAATAEVTIELPRAASTELKVDGKQVVFEGKESMLLRCGEASLELRKDGRIVLRGVHVISHAAGVNRIRGGSVQIN